MEWMVIVFICFFFFFKQKTAYEIVSGDWSSDVCSSDLEFNITKFLTRGTTNALALEVFAPDKYDLGITWVDWNPTPPDKNMGIWKEVFLTTSGPVAVRSPFVSSKLDAQYKSAELTISAEDRKSTRLNS